MKSMQRILVDLDDTVYDLLSPWLKLLNEKHNTSITFDDISNWDMRLYYPDLSKTELYLPLNSGEVWDFVEPFPNAIEVINELRSNPNLEVYFCTATHFLTVTSKIQKTIMRFFPDFDYHNLIVTHKKHLINADFLIDDGPHNLKEFQGHRILYTAQHNRFINAGVALGAIRANTWMDVKKILNNFGI
jgi:5'(3')-deoxyribonucleotidase